MTSTPERTSWWPTSAAQHAAWSARSVPSLEEVRQDVWAIGLSMPDPHIPYSLSYLLKGTSGRITIIDPGWDSDENLQRLDAALDHMGAALEDVDTVLVTHFHPDHLGAAEVIRDRSGAEVWLHEADRREIDHSLRDAALPEIPREWGLPPSAEAELRALMVEAAPMRSFVPDRVLSGGEVLDFAGFTVRVIATPGHTAGHVCFHDAERQLLFTGDHLLPTMHAGLGVGRPSSADALADYISSLRRVNTVGDCEVLPGHGYRFRGVRQRTAQSAAHHLRRSHEVAQVLQRDPRASIWLTASQLTWTAGWVNLRGHYLLSALTQTAIHVRHLRNQIESRTSLATPRDQGAVT